jgi:hypothetical protein
MNADLSYLRRWVQSARISDRETFAMLNSQGRGGRWLNAGSMLVQRTREFEQHEHDDWAIR